ncbi:MAG: putative DnaJ subfamily A member 1 [Streblomastix strix]|uniref:Putative DnaJ subfamily A member 1 n=1 Tax=Streblomastix strix TaxID=222440 RepID=A0A5J4X889_9EUKA|nr:MAG: putative DnaJ subfamily A member 1 [Streblomastix strix]
MNKRSSIDTHLYEVLGVQPGASNEEVEHAYRRKALQYLPGKNRDDTKTDEKFKELRFAYNTLKNPTARRIYSECGEKYMKDSSMFKSTQGNELFDAIFGEGEFPFTRSSNSEKKKKIEMDIEYSLEMTLEELYCGIEKKITYQQIIICPECKGRGAMKIASKRPCQECNGTGT